jgi:uncharacterized protein YecE (DUF72 family)
MRQWSVRGNPADAVFASVDGMAMKLGMCGFTIGAAEYFTRFPVVEVQQTFYDPPPLMTIERWRMQAPPGFEFTMKAWQVITHDGASPTYRRMKRPFTDAQRRESGGFRLNTTTREAWRLTLAVARTLRATGILLQCPASFRATTENISAMRVFLATVERPVGVRLYWEPRGPWPDDVVRQLCDELDLVHAVDPFVRPSLTPDPLYWRLHGNRSHRASYTDAELLQIIAWLPAADGPDAFVLFNNIPRVADVHRFLALLRRG